MDSRRRDVLVKQLRQRASEAAWTHWQLAHQIHETTGTPTLLMAWRLAADLTQAKLGERVRKLAANVGSPCSPSSPSCQQISRWENGHEKPGAFYQGLLAACYQTDPARLGLMGDLRLIADQDCLPAARREENNVDRREFLVGAATAPIMFQLDQIRRRMDIDLRHALPASETDQWIEVVDRHVAAYGTFPADTLLKRLAPDLADLADLAGQFPQQKELARLIARLCGLTGALYTDLGDGRGAGSWLCTADRYAARSGDVATQYWLAMAQAVTATYPSAPGRVLDLANRATAQLGPYSGASAAQLAGLVARAHAALGNRRAAYSMLQTAEQIASRLTASEADETFFGFPGREMLMYTSQVLTLTGDPAAWHAQTDALASYSADDQMDRPLILLARAHHLARHGDPEEAVDVATTAITSLAPPFRLPLLISEARLVSEAIFTVSALAGRRCAQILQEAIPSGNTS
jgi:transcriptional regulator with XRE-family HTH domain